WHLFSSGSGNNLHWQWELILPVGTLTWQWECLVHFIPNIIEATDAVTEDVIPLQPRRLKKRKTIVADAGGPSHPSKKLREDHETPSEVSVGGKSRSAIQ
nr:hypothetical protein [Tanacetum cinerariifolium]